LKANKHRPDLFLPNTRATSYKEFLMFKDLPNDSKFEHLENIVSVDGQ